MNPLTRSAFGFTLGGVNRGITLAVPGLALATAGGLWAEVWRAANAPVPQFTDHDPSGRYGTPDGEPLRIAVLGDSSVTGPGLGDGTYSWVARLADGLPHDVELTSLAKGGSRVQDVLHRQAPLAAESRPDLFIVAAGANDVIHLTPTRQFARQLAELLDLLGAVAPVVTLGIGDLSVIPRVPWSLRPALARRCVTFDRIHRAVTARRDAAVRVPVCELSDPHFWRNGGELFAEDLFHPNRRGHELWAELFRPHVQAALPVRLIG